MPENDEFEKNAETQVEVNVPEVKAADAPPNNPQPEPKEAKAKGKLVESAAKAPAKAPSAAQVSAAVNHDVLLLLNAVVHAAGQNSNRRCPNVENLRQAILLNQRDIVDWMARRDQRLGIKHDRKMLTRDKERIEALKG